MTTATKVRLFKRLRKEQIVTAEARLAHLRKIDNLTFLRYEDYCALPGILTAMAGSGAMSRARR